MKARYVEPWFRISTTITDRERISRWRKTRRSHDPFSRRQWGQWWRCPRSADCTTATNDGPPETTRLYRATRCLCSALCGLSWNCAPCTRVQRRISFTRLDQVGALLELRGSPAGMTSATGRTEFSSGTGERGDFFLRRGRWAVPRTSPRWPLAWIPVPIGSNCRHRCSGSR